MIKTVALAVLTFINTGLLGSADAQFSNIFTGAPETPTQFVPQQGGYDIDEFTGEYEKETGEGVFGMKNKQERDPFNDNNLPFSDNAVQSGTSTPAGQVFQNAQNAGQNMGTLALM